jgi:ATP-binding cassette subfamily B protein
VIGVITQVGPKLTEIAINRGMLPGHQDLTVVAVMAGLYALSVLVTALAQRWQVQVTGRLAAGVMNDLRVKVFTHLQRLSLDFFTDEKAGVIMSRMTSDIENLQQLVQDGLSQFAIQGLTMVVITVVLFTLNVQLALITVLLVLPILTVLSLWFRTRSEQGYGWWPPTTASTTTSCTTATSWATTAPRTTTRPVSTRCTDREHSSSASWARPPSSPSAAPWWPTTGSRSGRWWRSSCT